MSLLPRGWLLRLLHAHGVLRCGLALLAL